MKLTLAQARKKVKSTIVASGYTLWNGDAEYQTETMTADLTRYSGGKYLISCGCDYRLPEKIRDKLWQCFGEDLYQNLKRDGFKPDPAPYGKDQRKIFIITIN